MVMSSLRRAGFAPDAAYTRGVRLLSQANLCSSVPFEPPRSAENASIQQHKRQRIKQCSLGWQGGDHLAFLDRAIGLPHPAHLESREVPADLRRVISFIVNKREDIIDWRSKRMQLLLDVADSLTDLNQVMVAAMPPNVLHVAGTYNVAFIACLVDATEFPDVDLPRCFIYGFPVRGALPRTGLWGE